MSEKKNNDFLKALIRLCFLHNNSTNQILNKFISEYPNLTEFQEMKSNIKIVNATLIELNEQIKELIRNEEYRQNDHS